MERVPGIEPGYSAWKAAALPLSYTRISKRVMPSPGAIGKMNSIWMHTTLQKQSLGLIFVIERLQKKKISPFSLKEKVTAERSDEVLTAAARPSSVISDDIFSRTGEELYPLTSCGINKMSEAIKISDLPEFDVTDYLTDNKAIADYLTAVLEDDDSALLAAALGNIARARGTAASPKAMLLHVAAPPEARRA
jgi:hypothetical protein